jgi:hypothetical protein
MEGQGGEGRGGEGRGGEGRGGEGPHSIFLPEGPIGCLAATGGNLLKTIEQLQTQTVCD